MPGPKHTYIHTDTCRVRNSRTQSHMAAPKSLGIKQSVNTFCLLVNQELPHTYVAPAILLLSSTYTYIYAYIYLCDILFVLASRSLHLLYFVFLLKPFCHSRTNEHTTETTATVFTFFISFSLSPAFLSPPLSLSLCVSFSALLCCLAMSLYIQMRLGFCFQRPVQWSKHLERWICLYSRPAYRCTCALYI